MTPKLLTVTLSHNQIKPNFQAIALLGDESKVDVHTDPQVSAACGMALKFHCGDIPPGEGRSKSL